MPHCDAVVDCYGVELPRNPAGFLYFRAHEAADLVEVYVPRNELGERVCDRYHRLAEVGFFDASGTPEGARAGHVSARKAFFGSVFWHIVV